jgi:predicted signal transduction protein with EAL and GGDEF domain
VLNELAGRLKAAMPEGTVIGRFGRDEFGAVLVSDDAGTAVPAMRAAAAAVSRPVWRDQMILVGISAGIAQAPRDGATRDELIHRADLALLAAKRNGHGLVMRFEPELEDEVVDRNFLRRELRRAMSERTLQVHYQPIVAAAGSHIVGVEALLRWTHPSRGAIPPAVFIPVAESSGLMDELGAFVLRQALTDARRWPDLFVAINLSPIQVRDRALIHIVQALLDEAGIEPHRVVLEITEGVMIESPQDARARLQKLRALGVRIALDDFGSGYSSLSYLQQFPLDKLKIDKSFVDPLGRSANSGVIVQAIVALGRALGLSVLVEGVETEEQRVLLRLAGCDEMQGFLFARAVPREAIDRLMIEANAHDGAEHPVRGGRAVA